MSTFRGWLRRFAIWAASHQRPVRMRRGRKSGLWFSRGRGPRRSRIGRRHSQLGVALYERLEPRRVLDAVTWIGGIGNWDVAANCSCLLYAACRD